MNVQDLEKKDYLTMSSDSMDIDAFMSTLTQEEKDNMIDSIGTLWVDVRDGDYGEAYYCVSSVPWLTEQVYKV